MGAEAVRRDQRYTRDNPRPICDGWDRMARGTGRRCHGFLAADGSFARCRREEQAGTRPIEVGTGCYVRKLTGDRACGVRHDPTPRDAVRLSKRTFARNTCDTPWGRTAPLVSLPLAALAAARRG